MKETKIVFDNVNNQSTISKIDEDIVSIDREDEPLIYISKEAIYLKKDNDNLRKENKKQKEVLDKIKEYIKEYKNCVPKHISDYILELLEEIE